MSDREQIERDRETAGLAFVAGYDRCEGIHNEGVGTNTLCRLDYLNKYFPYPRKLRLRVIEMENHNRPSRFDGYNWQYCEFAEWVQMIHPPIPNTLAEAKLIVEIWGGLNWEIEQPVGWATGWVPCDINGKTNP